MPYTHIPIPAIIDRCENNCCSITTTPLRVFKVITIYKNQGITIGEDNLCKRVVVHLLIRRQRKNPGTELVAFSRATEPGRLTIGNPLHTLDITSLSKLGTGKACEKIIELESHLIQLALASQDYYI